MKRAVVTLLLAAVMLGAWSAAARPAHADAKPLAVVSFSGYDQWKGDIAYIGRLSDNPDLAVGLEVLLKLFTKNRGLEGLDKTRPWGAVVQIDGDQFSGCAFLPVTDLGALMKTVEPMMRGVEQDGDLWTVKTDDATLYAKQKGKWAFIANDVGLLEQTPDKPMGIIGDLNNQYDVAVRLFAANVPQHYRRQLIDKMHADAANDLQRKADEDEDEYLVRKMMIEGLLDGMSQAVEQVEQMTLGWALDSGGEKTYLDVTMSAKAGTKMADRFARLAAAKTNFAGFKLPQAAMTAGWAGTSMVDQAKVKTVIDVVRKKAFEEIESADKPANEIRLAKKLLGDVLDVVRDTVAAGKADGGISVVAQPDAVTLVAGGFIADGPKLESVAKQIVELARQDHPEIMPWVTLDADNYRGVNLHLLSIPIPPGTKDRDKAVRLIGEKLDVVVGMGPQSLYVAAGRDAMKTLKQAISDSADDAYRTTAPMEIALALRPIAEFVVAVGDEDDREGAALVASVLEQIDGRDHVKITMTPIDRGARLRLELEEGVLRLLGKMSTLRDN